MSSPHSFSRFTEHMDSVHHAVSVLRKSYKYKMGNVRTAYSYSPTDVELPPIPPIDMVLKRYNLSQYHLAELQRSYNNHTSALKMQTEARICSFLQCHAAGVTPSHILKKQISICVSVFESRINAWYDLVCKGRGTKSSAFNTVGDR